MKKSFLFLTFAVITAFTTFSLTSCGDDDDNTPSGGGNEMTEAGRAVVAVDLGLPSGTKWADRNVGASSKTDDGNYFAWGEIATKSDYSWSTYKYGNAYNKLTKYCTNSGYGKEGFTDNTKELVLDDDVANKLWGGKWRMPSMEQFEELISNTTSQWTTVDGKVGQLLTASNGNSIFLPAAGTLSVTALSGAGTYGFYWSRTLIEDRPYLANYLSFDSNNVYIASLYRYYGRTVRPVLQK